jgi:hypothetical protein
MSSTNMPKNVSGGYNNYSLRSATLVEGWMPGPMRQNFLLDPDRALGKFDPGTFGNDQSYNGPGTMLQAIPDVSKYQTNRVFAIPTGNAYRNFGVDDRQIASYQVEQLNNNPLSQYTTNPNGIIPGFECLEEPDDYSSMTNKREDDYKKFFENGNYLVDPKSVEVVDWTNGIPQAEDVYEQFRGPKVNANAEIVYNMSLNSREEVNPMIALGSSSIARSRADFSGLCYSGKFIPGEIISNTGGNNPPGIYSGSYLQPRTQMDKGMMNKNIGNSVCVPDRSLSFANPLVISQNLY